MDKRTKVVFVESHARSRGVDCSLFFRLLYRLFYRFIVDGFYLFMIRGTVLRYLRCRHFFMFRHVLFRLLCDTAL